MLGPRPPADPALFGAGHPPGAGQGGEAPLTVSQLAAMIGAALEAAMPARVRIIGEVSGFRERTHWYFDLKDEAAIVNCVMFAAQARGTPQPAPGQLVVVKGRVEFFARQGRVQLYAESMQAVGDGDIEARLRALVEELRGLGWLNPERKRRLPVFPRRVAVVTSRSGAAWQDVIDTARKRCPAVELALVDCRVQGDGAAEELTRAVRWLSARHAELGVDAILLTRGGGSKEDLWCFNDRALAQAIVECAVPVAAAIGHETDTTVAELVADERCATPTQAAMRLTPDRAALGEQCDQILARARLALRRRLENQRTRLVTAGRHWLLADPGRGVREASRLLAAQRDTLLRVASARAAEARTGLALRAARLARLRPEALLSLRRARGAELLGALRHALSVRVRGALPVGARERLDRAVRVELDRSRERLASLERELTLAGPAGVLRRGYSVTTDEQGRVVRSVAGVRAGAGLRTRVADGEIRSRVEGEESDVPSPAVPAPTVTAASLRARARTGRARPNPDQMDLFRGG